MTIPENKNPNGLPSVQERALECAEKIQRIALENPIGFADKHFLATWFAAILDHEARCETAALTQPSQTQARLEKLKYDVTNCPDNIVLSQWNNCVDACLEILKDE